MPIAKTIKKNPSNNQPVKAPKQEKGKKASCSYTMNNHIREKIKRTSLAENDCNFHVTLVQTCNTGVTKKEGARAVKIPSVLTFCEAFFM